MLVSTILSSLAKNPTKQSFLWSSLSPGEANLQAHTMLSAVQLFRCFSCFSYFSCFSCLGIRSSWRWHQHSLFVAVALIGEPKTKMWCA
jgi:hypothetical protein